MSKQNQLFSPDHEIIGQNIMFFTDAIESANVTPFLEKHNLTHLEADVWYPAQRLLDALNEIADAPSSMMSLVSLGMKSAETSVMPESFQSLSLVEVLKLVGQVYAMGHRGTNIGKIEAEQVSDRHVTMSVVTCWPDDLWYGVVYGYTRRFAPKGTKFTVSYDTDVPRHDHGGEATLIHIKWD